MPIRMIIASMATLMIASCMSTSSQDPNFAVYRGGDDGYTLRLVDEIEKLLSMEPAAGAYIKILIPNHVSWERTDVEITVSYSAILYNENDEVVGLIEGTCPESVLTICAEQVLEAVRQQRLQL